MRGLPVSLTNLGGGSGGGREKESREGLNGPL